MTLSEFKAWFEGYTEGLEAAPTKAQFDRIKEKVKEISGTPITYPIDIDRYVEPYRRWVTWGGATAGLAQGTISNDTLLAAKMFNGNSSEHFDSGAAMYALGKAEAQLA